MATLMDKNDKNPSGRPEDEERLEAAEGADEVPAAEGPDEDDQDSEGTDAGATKAEPRPAPKGTGFFHVYKPGQGYWVRMGTAAGMGLIAMAVCMYLYPEMKTWGLFKYKTVEEREVVRTPVILGVLGVFVALVGLWAWRLLNKPTTVEFMIATESEMRKVNWTSRKELIGSTRVVIFFMFLIAAMLFVIDIFFGYFFYLIRVLEHSPL